MIGGGSTKRYGGAELATLFSPTPTPTTMRSPLMDAVGGPPQIARIKTAPPHTEYPSVEFETRTSRHPRGDRDGFIDVQRPGRQQEELPQTQLSEEVASWRGPSVRRRQPQRTSHGIAGDRYVVELGHRLLRR